jgi:regulator of sirC expression with transglutaminase-like and TPR domain
MTWSSASGRKELEASLRRIGGSDDAAIDLAEAALFLAALDRPRVPLERYRHHLSLLARDTAELAEKLDPASLDARAAALNSVIVERYGYEGDQLTYDDLQNASLMRVIDRRKGLPVTLGILYIHAARAQGWTIYGLNFPGHFLLRLELGGERLILDPFVGGLHRDTAALRELLKAISGNEAELKPEHYAPVGNRDILLRVQGNIKLRLLQDKRPEEALAAVESMLMIAPGHAGLWREAGLLHAHLGNLRAAVMGLEQFLELSHDNHGRHEAASLLQGLKSRLN